MMKVNTWNALVICVSIATVHFVQSFFDDNTPQYFFALMGTTVFITSICCIKPSRELIFYSLLQTSLALNYLILMAGTDNATLYHAGKQILWHADLNLSLIVYAYEVAIIVLGGLDAFLAYAVGRWPSINISLHNLQGYTKGAE